MRQDTKVYFDGLCHLCSREIEHYRKQKGSEAIRFIDITSPDFRPENEGVDPIRVHREMHVRKSNGNLAVGVDAFIAIWETLPRYRFMAQIAKNPFAHLVLRGGYQVFATVRPYLPRKQGDCSQSPYCEVPKTKE